MFLTELTFLTEFSLQSELKFYVSIWVVKETSLQLDSLDEVVGTKVNVEILGIIFL